MEESRAHACSQGRRRVKSVSGLGMSSSAGGSMFALERKCQVWLGEGGRAQSWLGVTHCGSFGSFGASRSLGNEEEERDGHHGGRVGQGGMERQSHESTGPWLYYRRGRPEGTRGHSGGLEGWGRRHCVRTYGGHWGLFCLAGGCHGCHWGIMEGE